MKRRYHISKRDGFWIVRAITHRGEKARKPFIIARNLEKAWYRLERRILRYRSH